MPFESKKQQRKCYALKSKGQAGSWDCGEWSSETDFDDLPIRKEKESFSLGKQAADLSMTSKPLLEIGPPDSPQGMGKGLGHLFGSMAKGQSGIGQMVQQVPGAIAKAPGRAASQLNQAVANMPSVGFRMPAPRLSWHDVALRYGLPLGAAGMLGGALLARRSTRDDEEEPKQAASNPDTKSATVQTILQGSNASRWDELTRQQDRIIDALSRGDGDQDRLEAQLDAAGKAQDSLIGINKTAIAPAGNVMGSGKLPGPMEAGYYADLMGFDSGIRAARNVRRSGETGFFPAIATLNEKGFQLARRGAANQATNKATRWLSDIGGLGEVDLLSALGGDKSVRDDVRKKYEESGIDAFRDVPNKDAPRTTRETPWHQLQQGGLADLDYDTAFHRWSRANHPINYMLNPFDNTGPLVELMQRLQRRGVAASAYPDSTLGRFAASVIPGSGLVMGGRKAQEQLRGHAARNKLYNAGDGKEVTRKERLEAIKRRQADQDKSEKQSGATRMDTQTHELGKRAAEKASLNLGDPNVSNSLLGAGVGGALGAGAGYFTAGEDDDALGRALRGGALGAGVGGLSAYGAGQYGYMQDRAQASRDALGSMRHDATEAANRFGGLRSPEATGDDVKLDNARMDVPQRTLMQMLLQGGPPDVRATADTQVPPARWYDDPKTPEFLRPEYTGQESFSRGMWPLTKQQSVNKEINPMPMTQKQAVDNMTAYFTYLAATATGPLHVKQAAISNLTKLSSALSRTKNLITALRETYPNQSEVSRTKLAIQLIRNLSEKMQKAAAHKKKKHASEGVAGPTATAQSAPAATGTGSAAPAMSPTPAPAPAAAPGAMGAPAMPNNPLAQSVPAPAANIASAPSYSEIQPGIRMPGF